MLMVTTITTAAYWLTTRTLLYITHACPREAAISRTTSMQSAFLSRLASSTHQLYCASKALSCFVPMVKHHQEPPQAPPTNCPRIEKPPPIDKPRDTRNKVLHVQKPISSQTYSRINSLKPPVFVRFSA